MIVPINSDDFTRFIEESNIFEFTQTAMNECLKNWYTEDPKQFVEDMRANLNSVMNQYHFINSQVSFIKDFAYEPALDEIMCIIEINDSDDDYCMSYRAYFDYAMNIIDDAVF